MRSVTEGIVQRYGLQLAEWRQSPRAIVSSRGFKLMAILVQRWQGHQKDSAYCPLSSALKGLESDRQSQRQLDYELEEPLPAPPSSSSGQVRVQTRTKPHVCAAAGVSARRRDGAS